MLDQLRAGDVVMVTKYDRLARSLQDLLAIVAQINDAGAGFRSLGEDIGTTTPAGRLVFPVFASIAQFERERIAERTKEGLEAAPKRGRVGGRKPVLTEQQRREVRQMRDEEGRGPSEIAAVFKIQLTDGAAGVGVPNYVRSCPLDHLSTENAASPSNLVSCRPLAR